MAASAVLLLIAGLLPLRFDLRTFQMQARLEPLGLPYGSDYLVLTADNSVESAQISSFALPQWSFPRGRRHWITLTEQSHDVWSGGFLGVNEAGSFWRPRVLPVGWTWEPSERPSWLSEVIRNGALVYDSSATRAAFEARMPDLVGAPHVFAVGDSRPPHLPLERPSLRFMPLVWWRLTCVIGVLGVGALLVGSLMGETSSLRLLGLSVGLVTALGALVAGKYVAGQLFLGSWDMVSAALWLVAAAILWVRGAPPAWSIPARRTATAALVAVAAYAALFCLRLDFDGDTYTTYLQVARYYHWAGRHQPQDPGVAALVQGSVYPPGFPLLLSLPLWVTDQPALTSLALGPRSSLTVLLYRWLVFAFCLALMAALGAYVTILSGDPRAGWLSGLSILFILPMARGQHVAAETLLVPLLGMSLLGALAGRRFDRPPLAAAGWFLAGLLTLVKLDGLPFLVLLVIPATIATKSRWCLRRETRLTLALAAGLLPWLVWKISGPESNPAFAAAAPTEILRRLPNLASHALKIVIKGEMWLPLLLALPAAVILRGRGWRSLAPVAGIGLMSCVWVGVYTLSTLGNLSHMDTSFPRVMLGPCLASWIYALDTLWGRDRVLGTPGVLAEQG
jgi:hypothetical protein